MEKYECEKALDELKFALDNFNNLNKESLWDCISLGAVGFEKLIKEHFDNTPISFKDIKVNSWYWDNKAKQYIKVRHKFGIDTINVKTHEKRTKEMIGVKWGELEYMTDRFYKHEVITDE